MEFHQKLQKLRKRNGLTQEELAEHLHVSRTAISKWESGRGYPNIDSLRAIASFFSVTIDQLLSGDELLIIAEEDHKQRETHLRDLMFGLLDCSVAIFLFLPLLGQKTDGLIYEVSLLALTGIQPYLKATYFVVVIGMILSGLLALALQNHRETLWGRSWNHISLLLNGAAVLLFTISLQPYAAALLFIFLIIKVLILTKKQ